MTRRRVVVTALSLVALAVALVGALLVVHRSDLSPSADLRQFDPGQIVTDTVFYDSSTMTAGDIQLFLDAKGKNCKSNCLRNRVETTYDRAADSRCGAVQGGTDSAAWIIYKVARACGINPQVLLVTLQKEVGLVTGTAPTDKSYSRAMGYGCPDNAGGACDTQYYGLYNQLYWASHQFQNYRANPTRYGYVAGRNNTIGYHPNAACGSTTVYIKNQATAALYNYTPYVPNAAALANEYGTGDSCSSYGNRNFYSYLTDWFDGPQSIRNRAATANLGPQLGDIWCDQPRGGCRQRFTYGDIYWSSTTGAHAVKGAILATFFSSGGPAYMGYPTGEEAQDPKSPGTYYSNFEQGDIIWNTAVGAHMVRGELLKEWQSMGAASGRLGLPTGDDQAVAYGRMNRFQGGVVYWTQATGAHAVMGTILDRLTALGGPGTIGFPVADEGQDPKSPGTYYSSFERGDIVWNAKVGAHDVWGPLLKRWQAAGAASGPLGLPTGNDTHVGAGSVSPFQGGTVFWTQGTGARVVKGAILQRLWDLGGPAAIGYPIGEEGQDAAAPGTYYSNFQYGDVIWNAKVGAHDVWGPLLKRWQAAGAASGPLGLPTGNDTHVGAGSVSAFENGTVFWTQTTGARVVKGPVLERLWGLGGPAAIGYPTAEEGSDPASPGTLFSTFQNGDIIYNPSVGAHDVWGPLLKRWHAAGGATGPLGLPTADDTHVGAGSVSEFQGGTVFWTQATGARVVTGAILAKLTASGGVAYMGYPTGEQAPDTRAPGTTYVNFQQGDIISGATGTFLVRGELLKKWQATGAAAGTLGLPSGDSTAITGGAVSDFQRGSVYWSSATGARIVSGAILTKYRQGGVLALMGFPTSDGGQDTRVAGTTYGNFQNGDIVANPATGAHYVRGNVLKAWQAAGSSAGYLGLPTDDESQLPGGGLKSDFQRGSVYWSSATGARALSDPIRAQYEDLNSVAFLGYPTTDVVAITGGQRATFTGGEIYWSAATGAHAVRGAILNTYRAAGGPAVVGFPKTDDAVAPGGGGWYTDFEKGSVYWSQATGAHLLLNPLNGTYLADGGTATSPLGYPTSDTTVVNGQQRATFQNGTLPKQQ
ncbi:hypothetical protein [Modestobacter sp. NPDC049651]|uniref:hypothetical protein n=1 Tax=unclassified Modestobacter TaxID=2643866 RepID=UPI00340F06BB